LEGKWSFGYEKGNVLRIRLFQHASEENRGVTAINFKYLYFEFYDWRAVLRGNFHNAGRAVLGVKFEDNIWGTA
jgi:hypothetical protein